MSKQDQELLIHPILLSYIHLKCFERVTEISVRASSAQDSSWSNPSPTYQSSLVQNCHIIDDGGSKL